MTNPTPHDNSRRVSEQPTLRELVDMLPKPLLGTIPAYPRPDGQWRTLYTGHIMSEHEASDMILGYLVRWLLDRDCYLRKWSDNDCATIEVASGIIARGRTPIEAAVRAVVVVSKSDT